MTQEPESGPAEPLLGVLRLPDGQGYHHSSSPSQADVSVVPTKPLVFLIPAPPRPGPSPPEEWGVWPGMVGPHSWALPSSSGKELVSLAAPEGRALGCVCGVGECRWRRAGWEGRLPGTRNLWLGGCGGGWDVMWPVGFGIWGELPSAPRTVARAIATPSSFSLTVRYGVITEVGAHSNEDCPHGLLKWAAQPRL